MEMEEDMEVEMMVFEAREVDIDYEFDAPMFYDFTRLHSLEEEARAAELWFDSAGSYPPSPFVAKLVMREDSGSAFMIPENVDNTGIWRNDEAFGLGNSTMEVESRGQETYGELLNELKFYNRQKVQLLGGLTFSSHKVPDVSKSNIKSNFPRTSTLMKPTASVLAKQSRPAQLSGARLQIPLVQKERSTRNSSGIEIQATKRQKLDGGQSRKVGDAKQQIDFIHKAPNKDGIAADKSSALGNITREPDLETLHRAQRIKSENTEVSCETVGTRRFKARPLNRKILEAPSLPLPKRSTPKVPEFQEFHLKTLARAIQHMSATSSSSQCTGTYELLDKHSTTSQGERGHTVIQRSSAKSAPKHDGCSTTHIFKARPLDRKIFSNKGNIGVFRNNKKETTLPMEFNFQTEKRIQQNPPVDLFSKLSLTSELRTNHGSPSHVPQLGCTSIKGSKENRFNPLQTENKMTPLAKEKLHIFGRKPVEPNPRSLGIQ